MSCELGNAHADVVEFLFLEDGGYEQGPRGFLKTGKHTIPMPWASTEGKEAEDRQASVIRPAMNGI